MLTIAFFKGGGLGYIKEFLGTNCVCLIDMYAALERSGVLKVSLDHVLLNRGAGCIRKYTLIHL